MKVVGKCVVSVEVGREVVPGGGEICHQQTEGFPEHDPDMPVWFVSYEPTPPGQEKRYSGNVEAVHGPDLQVVHICECKRCGALVKVIPKTEQSSEQSK